MTNIEIVEKARNTVYRHDPDEAFSPEELGIISAALGIARIALRDQKTNGWISVKDRLPERPEHDWVLVIARFGTEGIFGVPHVAEYVFGKWQFSCLDSTDAEDFFASDSHPLAAPAGTAEKGGRKIMAYNVYISCDRCGEGYSWVRCMLLEEEIHEESINLKFFRQRAKERSSL